MKRVAILMYHQVESTSMGSRFVCPAPTFARQMCELRDAGKPLVDLEDVARAARGERAIADGAVAVTFDDGHASFYPHALPVLEDLKIPATIFIVAGKLGGMDDWMPKGTPQRPLMTAEQVRELPSWGVAVGSHSLTHARLPELGDAVLARELQDSRARLADVLGRTVDLLAYPHGLYDDRVITFVREAGYIGACSTRSGFNADGAEPLALRRIEVYGTDSLADFRRKLSFGANRITLWDQARYYLNRIATRFHG